MTGKTGEKEYKLETLRNMVSLPNNLGMQVTTF